jgi:hypothetical protein
MSATILTFPGVTLPRPEPVSGRAKTLVIKRTGRRFAVVMHPILSDRERLVRETFDSVEVARAFANRISSAYLGLYPRVIDQTGGAA